MPSIMTHKTTFIKVPVTNPRNDPVADFRAAVESCPPINSPINAPANGPMMIPQGPSQDVNTPMIKPILLPQLPYLVPPKYLVPMEGNK